uniref:CUB domain-containing protein n=1 Tax=Biomphalaria glabrata TaxID=6526 RepID=A0A2C9L121_BIOGL
MSCTDLWPIALSVFIIVSSPVFCKGKTNGRVIQTLEDEIGAENFTYYKLHRSGALRLELKSLLGDVDIYVSTEVQHPDYSNYDLKSETCGLDVIQIPSTMSRPVYIALFGHPNYLLSKYRLSTLEVEEPALDDYEILVDKYE